MYHNLLVFLALAASVCPRPFDSKDVYTPRVLSPREGTVWKIGEIRTVQWDTSDPPTEVTNTLGSVSLRRGGVTLPVALASNFSIFSGQIRVEVPNVPPANDYRIVLFGDSGNWSPMFTITCDKEVDKKE